MTAPTQRRRIPALAFFAVALIAGADSVASQPHRTPRRAPHGVSQQKQKAKPKPKAADTLSPQALAVQVGLDRAGFSPGEIDGHFGTFTTRALDAFRHARNIQATGTNPDQATIAALGDPYRTPTVKYTVTDADVAGPFQGPIPQDMIEKSKLPALGYSSPLEELSERFHMSPALLTALNPGVDLTSGATLVVAAVEPLQLPTKQGQRKFGPQDQAKGASIEITKESNALVVRDAQGGLLLYAPVTVGSEHDPLPVGDWKVTGVFDLPTFNYNPDLFWDAEPGHGKAKIAEGPNNPVGVIWIQINKEHFGMHGTPEPSQIGRSESHGCIRMTNWDVVRLASLVREGTPVILR